MHCTASAATHRKQQMAKATYAPFEVVQIAFTCSPERMTAILKKYNPRCERDVKTVVCNGMDGRGVFHYTLTYNDMQCGAVTETQKLGIRKKGEWSCPEQVIGEFELYWP